MAKIIAPNQNYSGISAGVVFYDGEGQCEDARLLDWFEVRGYKVIHEEKPRDSKTGQEKEQSIETKAEEKARQEAEEKVEKKAEEPKAKEKPNKKGK